MSAAAGGGSICAVFPSSPLLATEGFGRDVRIAARTIREILIFLSLYTHGRVQLSS
jgi:hypothetical protein